MKLALIGASGAIGSRVAAEALSRGHSITGIARDPKKVPAAAGLTARAGDTARPAELAKVLAGHDAVVSAGRFLSVSAPDLLAAVRASGVKRLVVVGGAGSLEVAPGVALIDTPQFPAAYKPEAAAGRDFLDALRKADDLEWSFLSPSALIAPGARTGKFRLGKDTLLVAADGKSSISIEDFAVALVDELETPRQVRRRFTVGY